MRAQLDRSSAVATSDEQLPHFHETAYHPNGVLSDPGITKAVHTWRVIHFSASTVDPCLTLERDVLSAEVTLTSLSAVHRRITAQNATAESYDVPHDEGQMLGARAVRCGECPSRLNRGSRSRCSHTLSH